MITNKDFTEIKYETLKFFWGYNEFRPLQEEIIDSILLNNDTLALLPTGGGKSLCYQLPALLQEGTCLVISPLLALMKDQVNQLKKRGIEAELISSELDESIVEQIYERCKEGFIKLLYVSPERIVNQAFIRNIEEIKISFIAVDEAHCISEWGQDFRPSYQNIKLFREQFKNVPCLALTATATPKVLEEIQLKLGLRNTKVFQKSFKRENLNIIIEENSDKYQKILDFLRFNKASGIIYTRTRKEAENLSEFLIRSDLQNVDYFHAGLSVQEKNKKQREWLYATDRVLISTNAFGMGIDKHNVRFIIHLSPSASLENYYQEIGRAGRDEMESIAILLWNQQDLENNDDILRNQIPNRTEFVKIVSYLYSFFHIADGQLIEKTFQFNVDQFKRIIKLSSAKINNVLNFLHNQELIYYNNHKSASTIYLKMPISEIETLHPKDAYFFELLLRNLPGLSSQKVYFYNENLAKKIGTTLSLLKEHLYDYQMKDYLDYIDGSSASIRFLKHRNSRAEGGSHWTLFKQIQRNKIQKWEEMKYFVSENQYCKMRLILSYFGEKNAKNCGLCSVCRKKEEPVFQSRITDKLLDILSKSPATLEQIAVQLVLHRKEEILEAIIELLDIGKIKMLDYRTYASENWAI
ncbi:MAG: RecQ family ATP-dependent DNA helicase [Bergeyella zoohelcum]|nr:RecQ family ATP-dependent DNA helicase [Bergeyella zoohelcum]